MKTRRIPITLPGSGASYELVECRIVDVVRLRRLLRRILDDARERYHCPIEADAAARCGFALRWNGRRNPRIDRLLLLAYLLAPLCRLNRPDAVPRGLFGYHLFSLYEGGRREMLGVIVLDTADDPGSGELSWYLDPGVRGRGLAVVMAIGLMKHARDEAGVRRFTAVIKPDNAASIRVAQTLGLRPVRMLTSVVQDRSRPAVLFNLE